MKSLLTTNIAILLITCSFQITAQSLKETSFQSPSNLPEMEYTLSKDRVAVGERVDISLNFKGQTNAAHASVHTSNQLLLHSHNQLVIQKNSSAPKQLSVTPMTEGIHLITIVAGDIQQSKQKPFAIRIIAGDKPIEEYLKQNGILATNKNGEKVISMKAEER